MEEKNISNANINSTIIIPHIIITILSIIVLLNIKLIDYPTYWFFFAFTSVLFFVSTIKTLIKITSTKLYFTNKKIVGKVGLINTQTLDAPLNKVNDILVIQNFGGKIFNYSTLVISTSSSKYYYKYIKNANEFKDSLTNYIDTKEQNASKSSDDKYDKLKELKNLLDNNIITKDEFDKEKEKILN